MACHPKDTEPCLGGLGSASPCRGAPLSWVQPTETGVVIADASSPPVGLGLPTRHSTIK